MATATITEFRNEPYADFTQPANRQAMEAALAKVRSQCGREYQLRIDGEWIATGDKLVSVNPSNPKEIIGVHHKATAELAARAVENASKAFAQWSRTPAADRVGLLLEAARLLRVRKFEFDAWLVLEAGKTWPEAEADVSEAIDFCEYYAREMQRLAAPQPVVQLPGEQDEMIYIPLGVGVIIPPWNFPLAILAGMTVAALVTGNTVVIKPSSETPTIAAKFAEVLLEAGFPESSFTLLTGSGAAVGDVLVQHPKTRFVSFTGSRDVGLRINELAAQAPARADLDQARDRRNGRQGRHHRGRRCRSRPGGRRRARLRLRLPGPEMLRLLARDCRRPGLRRVSGQAGGQGPRHQNGAVRRPRQLHGPGDQRRRAQNDPAIHRGR